jgi:putative glycosyltransferase (TIGR04372 family)
MSINAPHNSPGTRKTPRIGTPGRVIDFLVDQSRKTIARPDRIFIIAKSLAIQLLLRPLARRALLAISSRRRLRPLYRLLLLLFPRVKRLIARLYFTRGAALLDENRPLESYAAFERCLEKSADPGHFFLTGVCLMSGLGRFKDAMGVFGHANELRQRQARSLGLAGRRLRFLPDIWHGAFGHLAQIDYLVKLGILEGRAWEDTLLYVAPGALVPNRFLLDQWRPHLNIVDSAAALPLPAAQLKALEFDFLAPRLDDGRTVHLWRLAALTYRRWHAEGRAPLLALPEEIARRGRLVLASVGIPRDAWFVALHVREAASKAFHAKMYNVLNARVADFFPAIAEITRRGGWVIALGDPKMTPLPPLPNVFDYRHSQVRSDWMDIFVCSQARFFLGTSSGPAHVPPIYGVPAVLTNWWPQAQRPWHPTDIFMPKLYRRVADGRRLTLEESLEEPFGYCSSLDYLRETHGVVVEDNAPDDILLAVREMLDRLDGRADYDHKDADLRNRTDEIYRERGICGMSTLARDFARKHRSFTAPSASPS